MAEDSTQKLSWMAETSSNWIHVTPSNGVGSMEVTVKLDEAEATETELDGTIIFKCTEPGFEGIQKTVPVNREACKKKCDVEREFRWYDNITYPSDVSACGGEITVSIPYIDRIIYKNSCKPTEETPGTESVTKTIPENKTDARIDVGFIYPENPSETAEQCKVTIYQEPGPAYECQDFEFSNLVNNKITIGVGETTYVYYEPKIGYGTSFVITGVRSSDGTVATVSEAESSIAGHCLEIYGEKNGTVTASVDYTVNCEENCGSKEFFVEVTGGTKTYEITFDKQVDCSGGTVTFTATES